MTNFKFEENVSLKNYCTFHIGGSAKYLYEAHTTQSLVDVCYFCLIHNIKYKIIGLGANLLFDDNGYNGLIIVNKTKKLMFKNNSVYVDGGVNLTSLIMQCYSRSLSNFEHLVGIPSTIAGGIVNNVGGFNCELSSCVEYVEVRKKSNPYKKIKLKNCDCKFSYRNSIFKSQDYIITRVKLNLKELKKDIIKKNIDMAIFKKTSTQPIGEFSAGSVFKRGNLIPAKVIDELGLKGFSVGNAMISTKHAGFVVNKESACAQDVLTLIDIIKQKVKEKYNKKLDLEIEIVK